MKFLCVILLAAPCAAITLRSASPPVAAEQQVCAFPGALSFSLGLGDDAALTNASASLDSEPSTQEKKAALKEAIMTYKEQQAKFSTAEANLMSAMEALLEVPSVDPDHLSSLVSKKSGQELIVFYAAWCPHCQSFVLHDGKGDPTQAPFEVLRRELKADNATASVNLARVDVQKYGKMLQAPFIVEGIPTVYMVKDGVATKFTGNPHELSGLKDFIAGKAAPIY
jgi:thiol-disulfide isomerase/thioredoxin